MKKKRSFSKEGLLSLFHDYLNSVHSTHGLLSIEVLKKTGLIGFSIASFFVINHNKKKLSFNFLCYKS